MPTLRQRTPNPWPSKNSSELAPSCTVASPSCLWAADLPLQPPGGKEGQPKLPSVAAAGADIVVAAAGADIVVVVAAFLADGSYYTQLCFWRFFVMAAVVVGNNYCCCCCCCCCRCRCSPSSSRRAGGESVGAVVLLPAPPPTTTTNREEEEEEEEAEVAAVTPKEEDVVVAEDRTPTPPLRYSRARYSALEEPFEAPAAAVELSSSSFSCKGCGRLRCCFCC